MNINITDPIFHDEAKATAHIEAQRWGGEPVCPHCGSLAVRKMGGKTQKGMFLCNDCRDKFTVRTGTVMERSHVPLHKWLLAMHIMAASKKGMSASQLGRMLGVTYKTAWFLAHRIREAMEGANPTGPLGGKGKTVEADETFVGGKARNRAFKKPAEKKIVLTLVERGGYSRSFHIATINHKTLKGLIYTNVDRESDFMTDMGKSYQGMRYHFNTHGVVEHQRRQYVDGDKHNNSAENFFSIFKRGVVGTYHHMSEAHLGRYLAEFDLRANTRDLTDAERAGEILRGAEGRRLTYRRTGKLAA